MGDNDSDITSGHPTTRHLRPAAAPAAGGGVSGPYSASFPADAYLPYDTISYGPDIADDRVFRLLGNLHTLEGTRILELGCGGGQAAIALAKQGAKVIAVDPSLARLDEVRSACDREDVKIELHQSDLAEIAFVRADTIDAVISIYALATVPDLDRVFRQAHRVLRPEQNIVFSLPHPAFNLVDPTSDDPLRIQRSYFDREPRPWTSGATSGHDYPRTMSELVTSLTRANFRVDTVLEPEPASDGVHSKYFNVAMHWVPATLIIRARKEGI
jgi:ubiquinone/menaquinone biosynthesis C-methylase UbiE